MKVLIVGGTMFLGRGYVGAARARGHEVARFSRGRHTENVRTRVETLIRDRNGDVSANH